MNTQRIISTLTIAALMSVALPTIASDSAYYIENPDVKDRIRVHNDGKNTYIAATRGLVVPGATADGEGYIIHGVPARVQAELKGKEITFVRGMREPPPKQKVVEVQPPTAATLRAQINQIQSEITRLAPDMPVAEAEKAPVVPVEVWPIRAGERISDVFGSWSTRSGTQFVMDASDGAFRIDAEIKGTFVEATVQAVDALNRSGKNIQAVFSNNQSVLRLKEK